MDGMTKEQMKEAAIRAAAAATAEKAAAKKAAEEAKKAAKEAKKAAAGGGGKSQKDVFDEALKRKAEEKAKAEAEAAAEAAANSPEARAAEKERAIKLRKMQERLARKEQKYYQDNHLTREQIKQLNLLGPGAIGQCTFGDYMFQD